MSGGDCCSKARFAHGGAGDQHRGGEQRAEQEGDAPPPRVQGGTGDEGDGEGSDAGGEQRTDLAGGGGQRGDQAAPLGCGAFDQVGGDAGVFAADGEAHDTAQQQQQRPGGGADLVAGREQGGGQHRGGHHRHRAEQHLAAPEPVPDVAEGHRAERAHQVGDGEDRQGDQERGGAGAEEHPGQHGGGVKSYHSTAVDRAATRMEDRGRTAIA